MFLLLRRSSGVLRGTGDDDEGLANGAAFAAGAFEESLAIFAQSARDVGVGLVGVTVGFVGGRVSGLALRQRGKNCCGGQAKSHKIHGKRDLGSDFLGAHF